MKKKYFYLVVLLSILSLTMNAQSPNFEWAKTIGSTEDDYSASVTSDSSGNIYLTGYYTGTVDFDPSSDTYNLTATGEEDIFIQKLDSNGDLIWAKSIGGNNYDIAQYITLDPTGNVYITGSFSGTVDFDPGTGTSYLTSASSDWDIFLLKLDANGNFIWANNTGGTNGDVANAVATDANGNVYIAGYLYANGGETIDTNPGPGTSNYIVSACNDIFVQKFDPTGNFVWAIAYGNSSCNNAQNISIDSSNNIYITGNFSDTVDFDPGPGTANLTSVGSGDMFIQKLNADGDLIWAKSFEETSSGEYISITNSTTTDDTGDLYLTGYISGTVDFDTSLGSTELTAQGDTDIFITKLDPSGNLLWAHSMGGGDFDIGQNVVTDSQNNVYVVGDFEGTTDFNPGADTMNLSAIGNGDAFIQKLDASGNLLWASSFGGAGTWCSAYAISNDTSGNLYLTGGFAGTVDFNINSGTENLTSAGGRDIFIQKLSQQNDSSVLWSSNSDDYNNFSASDNDGDTFGWKTQNGSVTSKGLTGGTRFFSESFDVTEGVLTPDNLLITPSGAIEIPNPVSSITFKLNVEASNSTRPAEHFAVYVFDEAIGQSFDHKIYEETLSIGGVGTAKNIIAPIPTTFAGKDIGIIVRHYDCTGQDKLYIDDFEVSYESSSLSNYLENNPIQTIYPNPAKNKITININKEAIYSLSNINGQTINKGMLLKGSSSIDLSTLGSGMYFLNFKTDTEIFTKKIIKQ